MTPSETGSTFFDAWQLTRRNPGLWWLAVLDWGSLFALIVLPRWSDFDFQDPLRLFLSCVIGGVWLGLFIGSLIGYGGLISGAFRAGTQGRVSVREALDIGGRNVGHLFLIRLGIAMALLLGVLLGAQGCVAWILIWLAAFIVTFAQVAIVIDDLTIGQAITRAWGIVRDHLRDMIGLSLLTLLVVGAWLGLASVTQLVLNFGAFTRLQSGLAWLAGFALGLLACALNVWVTSAVTLTYVRLTRATPSPFST